MVPDEEDAAHMDVDASVGDNPQDGGDGTGSALPGEMPSAEFLQEILSSTTNAPPQPAPLPVSADPQAVSVQFPWGTDTFRATPEEKCGRFVYKTRGSIDGKGGLTLSFTDEHGGCWELGGSTGTLYRRHGVDRSPSELIGYNEWQRSVGGGIIWITVMRSASSSTTGGWIDPALLAFDRKW
mmetsp:Transcript_28056/g.74130  ORF Transcript_28056/g.74130 Transcript_28056/m.74130 type:complete len:182 (-) Transcript_28056:76-621(-)|eukprot:CAMPEP_0194527456 /NCGR_PEP_ID=MMETSP0253-20130528/63568_1 /TAXON_ID=2966 /ORGANISM="Noctiluca scintillans" /LENGTH=181 /DNA_ID=CAMNT_0039372397 /DNA_START=77 /DNA_END=622 /DNA_ORIENTATION=+